MPRCSTCGVEKGLLEFYRNPKNSNGLQSQCKKCQTKSSVVRRKQQHRQRREALIASKGAKCQHCQGSFPIVVYDLHHLDPAQKDFHFNDLAGRSWERIAREADKCVLLCSNCHRIEHARLRAVTTKETKQ